MLVGNSAENSKTQHFGDWELPELTQAGKPTCGICRYEDMKRILVSVPSHSSELNKSIK